MSGIWTVRSPYHAIYNQLVVKPIAQPIVSPARASCSSSEDDLSDVGDVSEHIVPATRKRAKTYTVFDRKYLAVITNIMKRAQTTLSEVGKLTCHKPDIIGCKNGVAALTRYIDAVPNPVVLNMSFSFMGALSIRMLIDNMAMTMHPCYSSFTTNEVKFITGKLKEEPKCSNSDEPLVYDTSVEIADAKIGSPAFKEMLLHFTHIVVNFEILSKAEISGILDAFLLSGATGCILANCRSKITKDIDAMRQFERLQFEFLDVSNCRNPKWFHSNQKTYLVCIRRIPMGRRKVLLTHNKQGVSTIRRNTQKVQQIEEDEECEASEIDEPCVEIPQTPEAVQDDYQPSASYLDLIAPLPVDEPVLVLDDDQTPIAEEPPKPVHIVDTNSVVRVNFDDVSASFKRNITSIRSIRASLFTDGKKSLGGSCVSVGDRAIMKIASLICEWQRDHPDASCFLDLRSKGGMAACLNKIFPPSTVNFAHLIYNKKEFIDALGPLLLSTSKSNIEALQRDGHITWPFIPIYCPLDGVNYTTIDGFHMMFMIGTELNDRNVLHNAVSTFSRTPSAQVFWLSLFNKDVDGLFEPYSNIKVEKLGDFTGAKGVLYQITK